jgi:hypothetical protein
LFLLAAQIFADFAGTIFEPSSVRALGLVAVGLPSLRRRGYTRLGTVRPNGSPCRTVCRVPRNSDNTFLCAVAGDDEIAPLA